MQQEPHNKIAVAVAYFILACLAVIVAALVFRVARWIGGF